MRKVKNNQQVPPMIPAEGFMRIGRILEVFPVSRAGWWQGVKNGIYPAPVKIGKRMTAWRVSDIRALLAKF